MISPRVSSDNSDYKETVAPDTLIMTSRRYYDHRTKRRKNDKRGKKQRIEPRITSVKPKTQTYYYHYQCLNTDDSLWKTSKTYEFVNNQVHLLYSFSLCDVLANLLRKLSFERVNPDNRNNQSRDAKNIEFNVTFACLYDDWNTIKDGISFLHVWYKPCRQEEYYIDKKYVESLQELNLAVKNVVNAYMIINTANATLIEHNEKKRALFLDFESIIGPMLKKMYANYDNFNVSHQSGSRNPFTDKKTAYYTFTIALHFVKLAFFIIGFRCKHMNYGPHSNNGTPRSLLPKYSYVMDKKEAYYVNSNVAIGEYNKRWKKCVDHWKVDKTLED